MIEVNHLVRTFGRLVAVDDLSLRVVPGEVLGFLGPNGAGKSTTMKVLTGFLKPSSGSVHINGIDVELDPLSAQKQIGYLPEGAPTYEEMTVQKFLTFIAELRGFRGEEVSNRVAEVVGSMSLGSVISQRIENLSKGFKRRVGLAQAIIHDPKVLILDEPTDGLDPNQKHQVRELIRGLAKDKIVVVSTHILEEVTAVCTRAVIISKGKILEDCEPASLEKRSRYHGAVTVTCANENDFVNLCAHLDRLLLGKDPLVDDKDFRFTFFRANREKPLLAPVSNLLAELNISADLISEKGRLDEVFRDITMSEG